MKVGDQVRYKSADLSAYKEQYLGRIVEVAPNGWEGYVNVRWDEGAPCRTLVWAENLEVVR